MGLEQTRSETLIGAVGGRWSGWVQPRRVLSHPTDTRTSAQPQTGPLVFAPVFNFIFPRKQLKYDEPVPTLRRDRGV